MSRALSWEGCAAQWTIRSKRCERKSASKPMRSRMSRLWWVKFFVARRQSIKIPGRVAEIAKKDLPHVVVDPMDLMALAIEMFHSFGADESARAGYQNSFRRHSRHLSPKLTSVHAE